MANDENQIDVPSDEQSGSILLVGISAEQKSRINTLKK